MRIISKARINEFINRRPDAREPLERWYRLTKAARWNSFGDIRSIFPHADLVDVASGRRVVVFNIGGGKHRLTAAVHFDHGKVFILRIMTHAEYDRDDWKEKL